MVLVRLWWKLDQATVSGRVEGGGNNTATKGRYAAIRVIPTASNSYIIEGDAGNAPFLNQYSIAFDGTDDQVTLGNITSINSATNWSWTGWFKSSVASKVMFGGGSTFFRAEGFGIFCRLVTSGGNVTLTLSDGSGYNDGVFRHIAFTYSSGTGTIYINGSSVASGSFGSAMSSSAGNDWYIGRTTNTAFGVLNGNMDEIGVWDSTLSAAEVTEIYASGSVIDLASDTGNYTSSSNLQHWWRGGDSDGGTGTNLTDAAGSLNGTLENGASFVTSVP